MSQTNTIYFSDGYGLKKINIVDCVGESQFNTSTLFSNPSIPSNHINSISGEYIGLYDESSLYIDSHSYILCSFVEGYGCLIVEEESGLNIYSDGYITFSPKINDRGILYLINKDTNSIDVYYGAHFRSGSLRSPDFIYNTTSTPSIFPGVINSLFIVNNESSQLANGTRLYIGTTLGLTRVDGYDYDYNGSGGDGYSGGYCAGLDSYGISTTYSIVGGGADYESIGGSVANVVAVSSNESLGVILVGTSDGIGDGGITQISLGTNRKIIFFDESSGLIPSNYITSISCRTF